MAVCREERLLITPRALFLCQANIEQALKLDCLEFRVLLAAPLEESKW
jgi:hypothetical protein